MVRLIKKTIYYEGMPLRPLKMGKISILTSKNLAKKISHSVIKYLKNLEINTDLLDIYYQRSWATFTEELQKINFHTHSQSNISFAYYLLKPANSGGIIFKTNQQQNEIAKNIFGPRDSVFAWGAGQAGKAVACDGGYKVSGTWRFASGAGHATWLGGHSMVFEQDGSPRINKEGKHVDRTALFMKTAATMIDDWHVVGLKGTRSESYSVKDMFIPDSHTLAREAPDECRIESPLYIFPTTLVYASCFSGVALGIARGSLDDLIRLAQTKVQRAARSSLRESPVFQSQLAELEAKWGAAKAYQQATLIEITARVVDTRLLSMSDRAKIRLATTYAINEATDVVQKVYRLAGSTAIFENQPFERRFRDMHAVSQQMQARYTHFETVGRHLMDLDNTAAHM